MRRAQDRTKRTTSRVLGRHIVRSRFILASNAVVLNVLSCSLSSVSSRATHFHHGKSLEWSRIFPTLPFRRLNNVSEVLFSMLYPKPSAVSRDVVVSSHFLPCVAHIFIPWRRPSCTKNSLDSICSRLVLLQTLGPINHFNFGSFNTFCRYKFSLAGVSSIAGVCVKGGKVYFYKRIFYPPCSANLKSIANLYGDSGIYVHIITNANGAPAYIIDFSPCILFNRHVQSWVDQWYNIITNVCGSDHFKRASQIISKLFWSSLTLDLWIYHSNLPPSVMKFRALVMTCPVAFYSAQGYTELLWR